MPVHTPRLSTRFRRILLATVVGIMLLAGLNPRDFLFRNGASRTAPPPGLEFAQPGIAFTEPFVTEADAAEIALFGFTTEIALELPTKTPSGFGFLAVFHNGDDASQWILGQWRHHLILLNGDDYSHERRWPRISVDVSEMGSRPFVLTITSDSRGSKLYLDGERINARSDFEQTLPTGGRLVLGNSVFGKQPWAGTIRRLAFHRTALNPAVVARRAGQWLERNGARPDRDNGQPEEEFPIETPAPWLLYAMAGAAPHREPELNGTGHDLAFPPLTTFLDRIFLSRDLDGSLLETLTSRDAILNYLGFIPFGWILAGSLARNRRRSGIFIVLAVTVMGCGLSLGIEFIQTWMPPRSSSLVDLLLNTAGSCLGAGLGLMTSRAGRN
jgi:hypothetical protein